MSDLNHNDAARRKLLKTARVIAVVGMSDDPYFASYAVGMYLRNAGYVVYPVNPMIEDVEGVKSYDSLMDVPEPIDIVDVFRSPEFLPEVVDDAIAVNAKTIWTQLDVIDLDGTSLARAREVGINIVEDRCIMTDHKNWFGSGSSSENTGVASANG